MSGYVKTFDDAKVFLIKDDQLLEKYNKIWDKVSISTKEEFDSKPVYNEN